MYEFKLICQMFESVCVYHSILFSLFWYYKGAHIYILCKVKALHCCCSVFSMAAFRFIFGMVVILRIPSLSTRYFSTFYVTEICVTALKYNILKRRARDFFLSYYLMFKLRSESTSTLYLVWWYLEHRKSDPGLLWLFYGNYSSQEVGGEVGRVSEFWFIIVFMKRTTAQMSGRQRLK